MIELKVGDRVRVRYVSEFTQSECEFIGNIQNIDGNVIAVDNERGRQCGCNTINFVHRWQVRKLVKVRKCYYCAGLGKIYAAIILDQEHPEPVECPKCNGKGKVRV